VTEHLNPKGERVTDREALADALAFVRRIKEYRCHRAMEEDELPFNTCDYYAMEDLEAGLARLAEPQGTEEGR
jgi:hypothetical protein